MAETCSVVAGFNSKGLLPCRRPRHSPRWGAISAGSSLKPLGPAACLSRSKVSFMSCPRRGGAAQAVIDGFAQSGFRHRHDRDAARLLVQIAQHGEEIGGGFAKIAPGAEIQHGFGRGPETKPDL